MELLDVVNEYGIPTGEIVERNTAHSLGIRHRTAHIWVVRRAGNTIEVLLQKRCASKESYPLCYDTSSAGHISAGDEPLPSAIRELYEELGISANESDLIFIGTFTVNVENEFHGAPFKDNEVPFVFVYVKPVDETALVLQPDEVDSVKWFNLDYVLNERILGNSLFCVAADSLRMLKSFMDKQSSRI